MTLDVVIGVVGVIVTILVIVGMILITPYGTEISNPPAETPDVDDIDNLAPTDGVATPMPATPHARP